MWFWDLGIYLFIFAACAVVTAIHIYLREW